MSFLPFKNIRSLLSALLLIAITGSISIRTKPVLAEQKSCEIEPTERTLFSHRPQNIDRQIKLAMNSAQLQGKVEKILWAKGLQAYEFINGKPQIYAPSAELFLVESLGKDIYLFGSKKIGSHYKLNTPAWEFSEERLIAEEVTRIDGAEQKDAPWLLVRTNKKDYYILRIETRGGIPPQCNFEGILGVPYQTLYVIVKTDAPQASRTVNNK